MLSGGDGSGETDGELESKLEERGRGECDCAGKRPTLPGTVWLVSLPLSVCSV